jgi:PAS domain S-box-containing protein
MLLLYGYLPHGMDMISITQPKGGSFYGIITVKGICIQTEYFFPIMEKMEFILFDRNLQCLLAGDATASQRGGLLKSHDENCSLHEILPAGLIDTLLPYIRDPSAGNVHELEWTSDDRIYQVCVTPVATEQEGMLIARDITEEGQTLAQLRAIVDHNPDGMFIKSVGGSYIHINQKGAEFLGCTVEEALGMTDATLLSLKDSRQSRDIDLRIMATGEPRTYESKRVVDGEQHIFLVTKFPYVSSEEELLGIVGLIRDITGQKQADEYSKDLEKNAQHRASELAAITEAGGVILNSVADGVFVTDRSGVILLANSVASRWLEQLDPPEDRRKLRETLRYMATMPVDDQQKLIELTRYDFQAQMTELTQDEYRMGRVIVLHDVTRLKALDRLRAQFISNASHELRNPLSGLKLYITMLRQGPPEKREKYIDQIEELVNTMSNLVDSLLDLSHLDQASMPHAPQPVDLNSLTVDVVETLSEVAAADHGVTLIFNREVRLPMVEGDPLQLQQVLNNLIENALKFTPAGGQVKVNLHHEQQMVVLTVSDTGMGISPEEKPFIFERFFRAESARSQKIPGTGLGLAIVKEIVELHNGVIVAHSEPGNGTTFTVRFPVLEP